MNRVLDLSIILIPPPVDSPAEVLAAIILRCDQLGLSHMGDLLNDPLQPEEREDLRWYLEEYWKWPYLEFAARGRQVESLLKDVGKRLYRTVFSSSEAQALAQRWQEQSGVQNQISIVSDLPRILSLPWELLHDGQGFLVLGLDHPIPISRRLPQPQKPLLSTSFEPPLRILLVTARPRGTGFVDPRSIAHELLDEVQEYINAGSIELEFLRPPTLSALYTRLGETQRSIQVLHFDGHGLFDEENKHGWLAFEDDQGKLDLVQAAGLAQTLHSHGVRLVVLTACQSAASAEDDAFSSVAAQLLRGGLDAVVAMSASFLVTSAARYVEAFYRSVAANTPVPVAQERARYSLYNDPQRHLFRRQRDEEGRPVVLQDWWVPQFYQQRPVLLEPALVSHMSNQPPGASTVRRLNEEMPGGPHYGFTGRARELLRIERALQRRELLALHGFGGIGKTALAREAADWLTRTGMFETACFVSFENGGDIAWLLSSLGHFLDVPEVLNNLNDRQTALARLDSALKLHRTLIIADNLETILPGGGASLDEAAWAQLWDTLLMLTSMGAGIVLTSRNADLGDKQLANGAKVTYMELKGLHPEDAYIFASRLLNSLGIDRSHAPYVDLRDLLVQLDYHPLAIQLVLPVLAEWPLSKIRTDFATLLPLFRDDTATGRNQSLLASLSYSLQRLDEKQYALLPRLALFASRASEDSILFVTGIPQTEWSQLCRGLELAGLLARETLQGNYRVQYVHFHSILIPYLQQQFPKQENTLQKRYIAYYSTLARQLYEEDRSNLSATRKRAKRELPNFQHTIELLLEQDQLDEASQMSSCVIKFLANFGREREREILLQRIASAIGLRRRDDKGALTLSVWHSELDQGQREFEKGNITAAIARFTALLAQIEARPQGIVFGKESYEHSFTLFWLARSCREARRPEAEKYLRRALVILDTLIRQQPTNPTLLYQRSVLFTELGDLFLDQGRYNESKRIYEKWLSDAVQQHDLRGQAVIHGQLGKIAIHHKSYNEARRRFTLALEAARVLDEPQLEAVALHQLGMVALLEKEWVKAERYYRDSLQIAVQLDNAEGIAASCNELASIAESVGKFSEAEAWYRQVLDLAERLHPNSLARAYDNFTDFLGRGIVEKRFPPGRLAEARRYAEQALAIKENLDASAEIWRTLYMLYAFATMERRLQAARDYRRRERETYAAFIGNRYDMDRDYGTLIENISAAIRKKQELHSVGPNLAQLQRLEGDLEVIITALKRLSMGERNWHALSEDLERQQALFLLRVLERLK